MRRASCGASRRGLVRLRQNPQTERFWVIDYRIFDTERDGLSKLDHVRGMLRSVGHRGVPFEAVLMDAWGTPQRT
jgi:hypothetical protein